MKKYNKEFEKQFKEGLKAYNIMLELGEKIIKEGNVRTNEKIQME